jgi:pyruvate dehydrogenase E2 component (dihydrolipoamide acetyltransferase)
MQHILMPRLGLTMESGTVVQWLKKEGEEFQEGEIIVEIDTDKVTTEVPAQFSGRLVKILVRENESADVSAPIAEAE